VFTDKPAPDPDTSPPGPKLALATKLHALATKLHVCAPDCRDITLSGVAAITERDVAESADRSLLAVRGPATDKEQPIYVFDAVASTLLTTIHLWKTDMGDPAYFQRVAFTGSALYVAISASPVCSAGRLYDPRTGRQLGEIGGRGAVIDESAVVEDERITVANVNTGKVRATIAPWPHPINHLAWTFRGDVRFVGPDRRFAELGDGNATLARVLTARTGATALELPGGFDSAPPVSLGNELALAAAGSTELMFGDLKRFARRSIPLFAGRAALALLAATPKAIVAVQDSGDGTVAIVDGKATKLVPGPLIEHDGLSGGGEHAEVNRILREQLGGCVPSVGCVSLGLSRVHALSVIRCRLPSGANWVRRVCEALTRRTYVAK